MEYSDSKVKIHQCLFILLLGIFFLCSCSATRKLSQEESFETFYQRFHQDSLFQLSRLQNPMEGIIIEGKSIRPRTDEPWVLHKNAKERLDPNIFKVEQERAGNRIIERIYEPGSVLYNERHFLLVDKKWFLAYYVNIFIL